MKFWNWTNFQNGVQIWEIQMSKKNCVCSHFEPFSQSTPNLINLALMVLSQSYPKKCLKKGGGSDSWWKWWLWWRWRWWRWWLCSWPVLSVLHLHDDGMFHGKFQTPKCKIVNYMDKYILSKLWSTFSPTSFISSRGDTSSIQFLLLMHDFLSVDRYVCNTTLDTSFF